jgi:RecA-family ATPase
MDTTPELHDLPTTDQPTIPLAVSEAPEQNPGADFFDRYTELGAEIIEGTIREGQLVVFGGPYSVGKTPFLADLAIHVLNGRKWHGCGVQQRPVIVFDFESSGAKYKQDIKNIAFRLGVDVPRVAVTASHHVE